jgi:hypothetical protein
MSTQNAAAVRRINLKPLIVITLANYAAQIPYFLHNDDASLHMLPGIRAVVLMAGTLAMFALGLAGHQRRLPWGTPVLIAFLTIEAVFYAGTFATGEFVFQLANHSYLLKAVFVIGYASGATAGCYAYRLLRQARLSRLAGNGGSIRWVSPASTEKSS